MCHSHSISKYLHWQSNRQHNPAELFVTVGLEDLGYTYIPLRYPKETFSAAVEDRLQQTPTTGGQTDGGGGDKRR